MTIIERVTRLGLPLDKLIVIGSGVLDVLGIREARDIDMVVTADLFEQLGASDEYNERIIHGEIAIEKDDQDIWQTWGGDGNIVFDFDYLLKYSIVIDGVRFASPEYVLEWKQKQRRTKDIHDIQLLKAYLERKNNG